MKRGIFASLFTAGRRSRQKGRKGKRPEPVAHNLFTYGHLPIMARIILTAVGQNFSLSNAEEDASLTTASVVVGGPALFLCGNVWVKLKGASRCPYLTWPA